MAIVEGKDFFSIEVTGGAYDGREGLRVVRNGNSILVTGWYDGGCRLDVIVHMPLKDFLQQLSITKEDLE